MRSSAWLLLPGLLARAGLVHGQAVSCPPLDTAAGWARTSRAWSTEANLQWSNDSLRRVLLALRDRDQAARVDFGSRVSDTMYVRQLTTLDSVLAAEMSGILDRFGLPTRSMVGPTGSDAAMVIVQHSWPLQERVLALARAVRPGEISPEKLGMLEDRVLVHRGEPQRSEPSSRSNPTGSSGLLRCRTREVSTTAERLPECRRSRNTCVCWKMPG